ncbi:protein-glutamine gamma-glutamyltransferase 5-like [Eucyclogobius newberryi]|uniref:protein-glutamine gamma-glutamyltransferase 5-like n=1 Tax=Eucyclogobius newberryi TaxID=166745 RepID=UPI003B5BFFA3
MDCVQQTVRGRGLIPDHCQLKFVNFEIHENHFTHKTVGLSTQLVVRRGWTFQVTLIFHQPIHWSAYNFNLEVQLGDLTERFPVHFSSQCLNPLRWSARVVPENMRSHSVSLQVCPPVISAVASYHLVLHIQSQHDAMCSYGLGTFVLLCNPWCKDDPVSMPLEVQLQEYVHDDYGLVYVGTHQSVRQQPWAFGQYEPGVLEACLQLLQVSTQHQRDRQKDYLWRADPVYLCRVLCAMVNCNDDLGVLAGKWQGSYADGVCPTDWTGSAGILHQWVSSKFNPVRYGQCWVFACVLCTVLRALGIPSRVVTVFNAAHDVNANLMIEEYYSSQGQKFNLSKDSIWWVRLILHSDYFNNCITLGEGEVVKTDMPSVLVNMDSLSLELGEFGSKTVDLTLCSVHIVPLLGVGPRLEVSLDVEQTPSMGDSICLCVTISNHSSHARFLTKHLNAQLKHYNCCPRDSFWKTHRQLEILPGQVLTIHHSIPAAQYKSQMVHDDIVNVAVVIKDTKSKERVLAAQEFNICSHEISIEVEGGDRIQMKKNYTAHVSYTNHCSTALSGAVLCVEGYGLLQSKHEARLGLLQPGESIHTSVSIMTSSPGTKLLQGTFSHSHSPGVVSRSFHEISVHN